jgi:predicted permease
MVLTTAVAVGASMLVAMVPAAAASRSDIAVSGRPSARGWIGRFNMEALVVGQLALSLVLLVGAALLGRSLLNLQGERLGFTPGNVILMRAFPRLAGYTPQTVPAFNQGLYDRLTALPGVERATLARYSPFSGTSSHQSGAVEGYVPAAGERITLEEVLVGPSYPDTLGMTLLQGRAIGPQDTLNRPKVGMVNEAFVRRYFPDSSAIGRHFGVSGSRGNSGPTDIEIVGVLADARFHDAREPIEPIVFTALWQNATQFALDVEIEIRTTANGPVTATDLRRAIADVDGGVPLATARTLDAQVRDSFNQSRLASELVTVFGVLAVLLACVGVHGIMAQAVARRLPELGIRLALGASRAHVRWMFVRETLVMLSIGLAVGLLLSVGSGGVLASQLYGITATDAGSLAAAVAALTAAALVAGLAPAYRASRVDPRTIIRAE